jgi:hypothetical protein
MAKTNLGKVGLTPKKAYSASITYERLDFVTAGDSSYVSLQDNNLGHPVTDGAWWQVLASGAASTEAATAALAAAAKALEAAEAAAPVVVNVEGADVTINVEGNHKYICGELTSLTLTSIPTSTKLSIIRFASGATATQFAYPEGTSITGWSQPQPNTNYSLFIWEGAITMVYDE